MVDTNNTEVTQTQTIVAPQDNSSQGTMTTHSDEFVHKSKVNDIVRSKTQEIEDRTRKKVLAELQQPQATSSPAANYDVTSAQTTAPAQNTVTPTQSPEEIRKIAAEEYRQQQLNAQNFDFANQFVQKIDALGNDDAEFKKLVTKVNFEKIPHIWVLANQMPHTAEMIRELVKNPTKMANLVNMASYAPDSVKDHLHELSNSIELNKNATAPNVKEPLSQLKPSNTGTDNGKKTPADWKRDPRTRR